MSAQVISWSLFILPWLTLLFMKREDVKRYMPVGLFSIVATTFIHDTGITLGYWVVWHAAFPLNEMLPYFYGLIPVLTMWIFKYTNGKFWVYLFANALIDIGFSFYYLNAFLPGRGIYALAGITSFQVWLINLGHATVLYGYQKWQENTLLPAVKNLFAFRRPAAAKPSFEESDD
jgi:hypothetical protein